MPWFGAFGLLVALLLSAARVAAQAEPVAVFRQYQDARNRGDIAAALALLTDATRTDLICPQTCVGKPG